MPSKQAGDDHSPLHSDAVPSAPDSPLPDARPQTASTIDALQQELRQAQTALAESRKSEQLLAGLVESAMDAIIAVDESQRIVLFNPAAELMFGLAAAEAIGQPIETLIPEKLRSRHADHVSRFADTGETRRKMVGPGCVSGRRANGETFPVEVSISHIKMPDRRLFTAIVRDISQRMDDELALRESEERLALFAATTFEGIVVSERGRILDCNEQFSQMIGYKVRELVGRVIEELIVPEDRERVAANIRAGRESILEHAMLRKDGSRIIVEAHGKTHPIGLPAGRRLTSVRDITERKRIEQALRDRQADLKRAQSMGQIGSWRLNIETGELHLSDENCRILGIPVATPLSYQSFLAVVHPDDREYVDRMWTCALGGMPYDIEHRLLVDDTVKWVRQRAELEFDEEGGLLGGFGTTLDITGLKQAEQALMQADQRKDEFLAMLAHELRNPLTPIRNAAHVLGRLQTQEPRVQWAQQIIERQVEHLSRLVDDLLDVSRIVRGKVALKMETVKLESVVKHAFDMARPLIDSRGHQLALRLPEHAVHLQGDPVRLAQVLLNLLDNAAKFTDDGGMIEVEARTIGPVVEIQVRDNGIGIPADLLPQIFDLFQQGKRGLDRSQGGLGIGLTLVKRLVELHGGLLEARSAGAGQGSTFTICLPLLLEGSATAGHGAANLYPPTSSCRVLVVDDDPAVADSMSVLLQIEGHQVEVAANGETALRLARSFRPQLVLLDIGLQGMDGYEVARQLLAQLDTGVKPCLVAVTGYGHEEARLLSQQAGFDRHLVKPVNPEVLQELLEEISHSRSGEPQ